MFYAKYINLNYFQTSFSLLILQHLNITPEYTEEVYIPIWTLSVCICCRSKSNVHILVLLHNVSPLKRYWMEFSCCNELSFSISVFVLIFCFNWIYSILPQKVFYTSTESRLELCSLNWEKLIDSSIGNQDLFLWSSGISLDLSTDMQFILWTI
jgi:hypothetical protein